MEPGSATVGTRKNKQTSDRCQAGKARLKMAADGRGRAGGFRKWKMKSEIGDNPEQAQGRHNGVRLV